MGFKVPFDMTNYKDIAAPMPANDLDILNIIEYGKKNLDACIWKKEPTPQVITMQFREREMMRVLKTGVWIIIKDVPLWLPPPLYFALQYGKAGGDDLRFRVKRLKHAYFKIQARNNAGCIGTYTIKNRQDGETTMATTDGFWECLDGNMDVGQVTLQSKTRQDSMNPCFRSMQNTWQNLPKWFKETFCSDFASGDNIAEKLKFMRDADETRNVTARNIIIEYFPAVFNAQDGRSNVKKCILDEVNKWIECRFGDTLTNYKKFIMPGMERRGMFDIFSSPSDVDCASSKDAYELWKASNTEEMQSNGTTKSRIHRYYSNPLEGILGAYDRWGDADAEQIYAHIMNERANCPKDKLMAEIRAFPLNEEEMFGSFDSGEMWSNSKGIAQRNVFLIGKRFKDEVSKEPTRLYGVLEWRDGVKDSEVDFRQSDKDYFDLVDSRFAVSYIPEHDQKEKLSTNEAGALTPPKIIQSCLGVDPIDKRYATAGARGFSNMGMVNWKFNDVLQEGIKKCPTLLYSCRPGHAETAFEDAIKAAVFSRSMVQTESINSKMIDYFEDRGYMDWLLSKRGQPKSSVIKGDSPTGGRNIFLNEIISLIDAITNTPLNHGDPYNLEKFWFPELLEDLLKFNSKDTHANDITMAFGQALMGSVKLLYRKVRQPSDFNDAAFNYLLN